MEQESLKKSHSVSSNLFLLIITIIACLSLPLIFIGLGLLFISYQLSIPCIILGMLLFVVSSISFMTFKRWIIW